MRVSRDFYEKIRDGHEFKKTLFLEPAKPIAYFRAPTTWSYYATEENPPRSEYYNEIGPVITPHCWPVVDDHECVLGTPNPLFSLEDHCVQYVHHVHIRWKMLTAPLLWHYEQMLNTGGHAPTWNYMFICQPPSEEVVIRYCICFKAEDGTVTRFEQRSGQSRKWNAVIREEGVRIVDIVEKLRAVVAEAEEDAKQKMSYFHGPLEISARYVADEFCPYVQEVVKGEKGQIASQIKPGSSLVPVCTGQDRTVRKLVPNGPYGEHTPFVVWE